MYQIRTYFLFLFLMVWGVPLNAQNMTEAQADALFTQLSNWGRWGETDQKGTVNLITLRHASELPDWCSPGTPFQWPTRCWRNVLQTTSARMSIV